MIYVNSISVCPSNITLKKGTWYYNASVSYNPETADCKCVTWHSSDTNVATVNASSGYIYAKSTGSARIYATSADGSDKTGYITVTVSDTIKISSIVFSKTKLVMEKGKNHLLKKTIYPGNATNKTLTWHSSNTNVVTVNNGTIYAVNTGSATITATATDGSGKSASCSVTVTNDILVTDVTVNSSKITIESGSCAHLTASVCPQNATNKNIKWTSSDTNVAMINPKSGMLYGENVGEAIVYATAQDGSDVCGCCSVSVKPVLITSIHIYNLTVCKGEIITVPADVFPWNATNKKLKWQSSNTKVATINSDTGILIAYNLGTTTIYATSKDGSNITDCCTVTVIPPINVESVSVSPNRKTISVSETTTLTATIYPSNATNQTVSWHSSNTSVAIVSSDGDVTPVSDGTAIITVRTCDGGFTDSCKIVVDSREKVTIEKDGDFNKVVFNSSGKTWYCINKDVVNYHPERSIYETEILSKRSKLNYFQEDPEINNVDIKNYSDDEIKLLYAIDPYGVAGYISSYASNISGSIEEAVNYKDNIFRLLYGRDPKYYSRDIFENWHQLRENNTVPLSKKISESEIYFGMHTLFDLTTLLQLTNVAIDLASLAFSTSFFKKVTGNIIVKSVEKIIKASVFALSAGEALVKNKLSSYIYGSATGYALDELFDGTDISWALGFVTLYNDFNDLADKISLNPNFYRELVYYCTNGTNYNVSVKLKNGETYEIKDINETIAES